MSERSDCSILRYVAPRFAVLAEPACDNHDARYKHRVGNRITADLAWVAEAAELTGRPFLSIFFGIFLILGGWWLWYDFDKLLER
jgi:hypothetical protein